MLSVVLGKELGVPLLPLRVHGASIMAHGKTSAESYFHFLFLFIKAKILFGFSFS